MATALKYKPIITIEQYNEYCRIFYELCFVQNHEDNEDEIDLLCILIKHYDNEHYPSREVDPVRVLKSLMEDWKLDTEGIAQIMGIRIKLASDILNYKKGFPKAAIYKLANRFKLRPDAFNKPYILKNHPANKSCRGNYGAVMNRVVNCN